MDGNFFKNSVTPPPIPEFVFDLQRFDGPTTWTLTQETSDGSTTYKLTADGKEDISKGTLNDAFVSINAGDTVKLGSNITTNDYTEIIKSVTIDLETYTWTFSAGGLSVDQTTTKIGEVNAETTRDVIIKGNGGTISTVANGVWIEGSYKVTIEDGVTISSPNSNGVIGKNGVNFIMNGGTINAPNGNGVIGINGVNFIMNGGTINAPNGSAVQLGMNNSSYKDKNDSFTMNGGTITGNGGVNLFNGGASFTMNGGTIDVTESFAVSNNGNHWNQEATININAGTLSSRDAAGIYHAGPGKTNIEGGTITGDTGIEIRTGTLEVTGGTITGTGTEYSCPSNKGGSTTSGAGIAIAQHTTSDTKTRPISVNISGYNTNISGANALAVANPEKNDVGQTSGESTNKVAATINGGTLKSTARATNATSGNAILADNANVEITVTDGNIDGNVTVTKEQNAETNKTTTALKMEGGTTSGKVQVVETTTTDGKTTETEKANDNSLQVTGGTYTSSNSNVTNYLSTDVQQNSDGSVVNRGVGWSLQSDNSYGYFIQSDGEAVSLLSATFSSAPDDTVAVLKADSVNNILGVVGTATTATNSAASVSSLWGSSYNWVKFTLGTNAISLSPQTDHVKIKGTGFIGTSTTSLTAENATNAIYVDATDNSLNNMTGGTKNDTLIAGARSTTLDGGEGDDLLVGGTKADLFVYSAGKDVIDGYGTGDTVSLSGKNFVTDLDSLTSSGETFTLHFDTNNALTFKNAATAVNLTNGSDTYTYIKNAIMHDKVASLTADTTAFDATAYSTIVSINGSEATNGIKITANSNGNYMLATNKNDTFVGGSGNDTFAYSGGSDTITDFGTGDIVSLDSGFTAPTTFDTAKYDGSDYILSLGSGTTDSLTFKATSTSALTNGSETYSYAPGSIAKKTTGGTGDGITIGSSYYTANRFNGVSSDNSSYITIDAEAVDHAIRITGNDNANLIVGSEFGGTLLGGDKDDTLDASKVTETTIGTFLNGGDGADSLVGGAGNDTFVYTGGNDTIKGFNTTQDLVSVAAGVDVAAISVSTANSNADLVLNFDNEKLTFEGGASFSSAISLKSGRRDYLLSKGSIAQGKSVTLTADYNPNGQAFKAEDKYDTINASLVTAANITIEGNDNANYIVGGKNGSSLSGGKENDTLVGGNGADIFRYTAGNDVIVDFDSTKDKLNIDTPETKITKARASSRRLTFTMQDKGTLAFRSDDSAPAVVSLSGDTGYLTVDGVVSSDKSLKLFSSAKGKIDLKDDSIYSGITTVVADSVKSQSVTLVGGTGGGSFSFYKNNKKRDGFEYNGGKVTIGNYESGKDRINLGSASISGFSIVNTNDVMISLDGSADKYISLSGGKNDEVLIHQNSVNKGSNSYSKMVFATDGVMYDKAKATSATLWSNAGSYDVADMTVKSTLKKIKLGEGVNGISITAGDKNMVIDASLAGGVILVSGSKNDKFIGSSKSDMFVYNAGKDIIQDFNIGGETDQISLSGSNAGNLSSAKITAGKKSVKFKFGTKDVLTVKPTKGSTLSSSLTVNENTYTFGKNSIAEDTNVSLTSKFGGTYNIEKINKSTSSSYNYIDGKLVEKKLTFKGTTAAESLIGGGNSSSKTLFKGGGGADSLVGGASKDTFFYAKGDTGTATIANFDFNNDKLKIAGGTIAKNGITSLESGGVQFAMKKDKGTDAAAVGWFDVKSFTKDNVAVTDASKVAIKANNTYYWFATDTIRAEVTVDGGDGTTTTIVADKGDLITWSDKKVSKSDVSDYSVIELNYATNLVKTNVATAVSSTLDGAKLNKT